MLFRILTENKQPRHVEKLASGYFDGFTIYNGVGFWKSTKEHSLVLEVVGDNDKTTRDKINLLATAIKADNKQEAVLVQVLANESYLV